MPPLETFAFKVTGGNPEISTVTKIDWSAGMSSRVIGVFRFGIWTPLSETNAPAGFEVIDKPAAAPKVMLNARSPLATDGDIILR